MCRGVIEPQVNPHQYRLRIYEYHYQGCMIRLRIFNFFLIRINVFGLQFDVLSSFESKFYSMDPVFFFICMIRYFFEAALS